MASFPCQANERLGKPPKCDDIRFVSGLMIILMFGTRIYFFLYILFESLWLQFLSVLPDVGEYHAQKIFPIFLYLT